MSIVYTEAQLSPLCRADEEPVRVGWYLWTDFDEEYLQSDNAPEFKFANTVWRYWDGSRWLWHDYGWRDEEVAWHEATMLSWTLWRGLAETLPFKSA